MKSLEHKRSLGACAGVVHGGPGEGSVRAVAWHRRDAPQLQTSEGSPSPRAPGRSTEMSARNLAKKIGEERRPIAEARAAGVSSPISGTKDVHTIPTNDQSTKGKQNIKM